MPRSPRPLSELLKNPRVLTMFVLYVAFITGTFVYLGIVASGVMANDPFPGYGPGGALEDLSEGQSPLYLILVVLGIGQIALRFVFPSLVRIPEQIDSAQYINYAQTQMIVQLAFLEGIGISGVISPFLGASTPIAYAFCIIAIALLLQYFGEFRRKANNYLDLAYSERASI